MPVVRVACGDRGVGFEARDHVQGATPAGIDTGGGEDRVVPLDGPGVPEEPRGMVGEARRHVASRPASLSRVW